MLCDRMCVIPGPAAVECIVAALQLNRAAGSGACRRRIWCTPVSRAVRHVEGGVPCRSASLLAAAVISEVYLTSEPLKADLGFDEAIPVGEAL